MVVLNRNKVERIIRGVETFIFVDDNNYNRYRNGVLCNRIRGERITNHNSYIRSKVDKITTDGELHIDR